MDEIAINSRQTVLRFVYFTNSMAMILLAYKREEVPLVHMGIMPHCGHYHHHQIVPSFSFIAFSKDGLQFIIKTSARTKTRLDTFNCRINRLDFNIHKLRRKKLLLCVSSTGLKRVEREKTITHNIPLCKWILFLVGNKTRNWRMCNLYLWWL